MEDAKCDSFGKITFHGFRGISTVDYIIVSDELLDKFQNFVVRQPSPFSDHSKLVGWIRIPNRPTSSLTSQQELFSLPRQFLWTQESRDKFITALQSPESQKGRFRILKILILNHLTMLI